MNCPNCSTEMETLSMEGVYGPVIEVDACFACHVLWLDKRESLHLSPRGTLDLFRIMHERRDDPRHSMSGRSRCPRCQTPLDLVKDIGKGGRFSYYSCPERHGRLTPFSEFLKEKQFVRALSPVEQHRMRAEVKQVQCSGCGAPIDLTRGFECAHCGAPVTVLDADAVEKTLRSLQAADAERSGDPAEKELRARALASMEALRTDPDEHLGSSRLRRHRATRGLTMDLLSLSLDTIFGGF